ncbi:O-antigen ligase domain-containing protein [Falsiroseomonas sp. HW251]|uniref:O-antigen ligase domain-containing protein n=1 Tax=Falsiroseomonas sp. HW251 TaxID=3390998 RepID=UPI003D31C0B6
MIVAPLALLAGVLAAAMQVAGGLKTAPGLGALPLDLTVATVAALPPLLGLLLATRRWNVDPAIAWPLAGALLLPLWLVVATAWSPSREVAPEKLVDVVLAGPAMLAAGMLLGADPAARRGLTGGSLLAGMLLAAGIVLAARSGGLLREIVVQDSAKTNYQVAGLAIAIAAALAAVRASESRHLLLALCWLGLVAALAAAALLPGGRTALATLGLGVAVAPALRLWRGGRPGAALAWLGAAALAGIASVALLMLDPGRAAGLRTLERLTGGVEGLDARLSLWSAALHWGGEALPLGLGTGGFTIAAGHGERRGLYPHNHALEVLAEAGLPGLLLWLLAFGGGLVAAMALLRRTEAGRAARIAAMVLPVAVTAMVSSDLGNRMAWFALGLALSLGVGARDVRARG